MSTAAFSRGAHSMFSKPMIRKACHRKSTGNSSYSSSPDHSMREMSNKVDGEEMKMKKQQHVRDDGSCCWVPHERTGIFYPKGQEKVMEDIPSEAAKDVLDINYFSHN